MIRPSARSGRRRQRGGTKPFPFPPDNRFRYEPKTDRMPKKISPFRSLLLCAALSLTGFRAGVNTISNPPGEYDRKVETQRN